MKNAQTRMWKALKVKPEFNFPISETQRILEKFVDSKVNLIIFHIDLVGSTDMSMTLSIDKLSAIIRAFAQESLLIISLYGGYVLKYIGDAVLAFFVVEDVSDSIDGITDNDNNTLYNGDAFTPYTLQSSNVVGCAYTLIKVIQQGLNPVLSQYDYPELKVRIGIDYGEISVVQYGSEIDRVGENNTWKRSLIDMVGYTISMAVKMTSVAKPDHIVIGQKLYKMLEEKHKEKFNQISSLSNIWKYINKVDDQRYSIYESL